MAFCTNCGQKLEQGAKFCAECGKATNRNSQTREQRKVVYDGEIHKCPNCGELLEAFLISCPSCGCEFRGVKTSGSIKELVLKLEKIDSQKMPHVDESKSVMKMLVGKDFKKKDEIEETQRRFDDQKEEEKANLIVNYTVPNTKEDILEFMILASSNIDVKKGIDDEVSQAWLSKFEQIYARAKLLMSNTPDFFQIKSIYDKKMLELKNRKFKGLAIASFIVGGYVLLFSGIMFLAELHAGGVIGLLIGIGLCVSGIKLVSIYNKNKRGNL